MFIFFGILPRIHKSHTTEQNGSADPRLGTPAINKALLVNPFITRTKLKLDLQLVASVRTISKAIQLLGWRRVLTKYCQIVEPRNRVKRFIYCGFCRNMGKISRIPSNETMVELRFSQNTNYR